MSEPSARFVAAGPLLGIALAFVALLIILFS